MAPHRYSPHCPICQKPRPAASLIHGELIHGPVMDLIKKRHPDWTPQDVVCMSCLNRFRGEYVEDVLQSEKGELSALENEVIKSLEIKRFYLKTSTSSSTANSPSANGWQTKWRCSAGVGASSSALVPSCWSGLP